MSQRVVIPLQLLYLTSMLRLPPRFSALVWEVPGYPVASLLSLGWSTMTFMLLLFLRLDTDCVNRISCGA